MFLNARIGADYLFAETWDEMQEVVDRVLEGPQYSLPGVGVGDSVTFSFADDRHVGRSRRHLDNYLHVGVNAFTGSTKNAWTSEAIVINVLLLVSCHFRAYAAGSCPERI
ncbi:hypothetical protein Caci_7413 [Catenulispora acidiphila DSM 44928]|uniref:Uncharacterized protein n=1 Tax=Catenulispora acidiphila (strain DSM 44928 / JCM 14897 / NBRC 102108 / NRRL B-24433 / ID139908) TaxID=479433 RepID=C7Q9S0_CATAD|nr:hypothetical protein [Catenulispora acidiphila]ACU76239.1 hypothetical protein Caci_7413 [Catenulispora acidiphila DSM 44928]